MGNYIVIRSILDGKNIEGKVEEEGWESAPVLPGQALCQPSPLFKKLDDSIIEKERKRIGT